MRPTDLDAAQVIDFVLDAMLVLDADLQVVLANRAFLETFQMSDSEAIGRRFFDLGQGQWDTPELRALLDSVVRDSVTFNGFQLTHDFGATGVRRLVLNAHKPCRPGNKPDFIVLGFEEFVPITVSEKQLVQYEGRFQLIFESVKDFSIFTIDLNGLIDGWNAGAENVFGYSEAEIVGRPFGTVFTPEDREKGAPNTEMIRAAREGRALDERWHLRKDGSRFFASGIVTPLLDATGAILGFTKVARDITERKRAEERLESHARALREEHRRKDEFLAMLAHELRNPLAAIGGTTNLMRLDSATEADMKWGRDVIDRQVVQLSRLIDDLLDVSRISTGKIYLKKVLLDIREVISHACEALRPAVNAKHHDLSVTLPPLPLIVDGDRTRLQQAVSNLVANAVKYTDDGGQIHVSASAEGEMAEVRVRDNGVGISIEMQSRIFGLFEQVDGSLGRSQGGLGIGLSLVRAMVEMHDGTVSVESDGPGTGSEFVVRFPMSTNADPGSIASIATITSIVAERPTALRVMVVDDNDDTARGLARILKISGHEVQVEHDGPAALRLVASGFQPDVILLDIGLPGMTGHELARVLRRDRSLSGATFIAVSGYGQAKDLNEATAAGFDHHMIKPVDIDRLLELVSRR